MAKANNKQAVETPVSRVSKVTIAPTIAARKAGKLSWQALCAAARGTRYTYTELRKGIKEGMSREI